MNRTLRSLVAGSFIAAATTIFTSACVDNNATMFIVGVLYRVAPGCTVTNDPNNTFLGSGILDVAFTKSYQATLLVGNQYTTRGNKQNLKVETTRVNLKGAEVTLKDSQGNETAKFSVYGSGFADSSKGEDPGYGIFDADLIPESIGQALADQLGKNRDARTQVVASVRVFGDSLGNQSVTSGELSYPIDICYGCLVTYPLTAVNGKNECVATATEVPVTGCRLGQDDPIDCRSCKATYSVCTSPTSTSK
jgi:hypothetical protein